jgi:catechol 2,3-dioxygenase-like lactoylglutathione lyase family enzyme
MTSFGTGHEKFNVGGILLDRPFKARRLGHFGFDNVDMPESVQFYSSVLGLRISDLLDHNLLTPHPERLAGLGDTNGYFMRYGTDHHSFALFNRRVRAALGRLDSNPEVTTNQITFQVSTLREVVDGHHWIADRGVTIQRAGRDRRGSNWHTYFYDPDGHAVELYYGIEQIGWNGYSKLADRVSRRFNDVVTLPQVSELDEVQEAIAAGIDLSAGYRGIDLLPPRYDVGGIMLPRPFKIVHVGPVRLFVKDLAKSEAFYREIVGLVPTEEIIWRGHRCVFLRAGNEHHSIALYPIELRSVLGLSSHTNCFSFGLQIADYQQLRDAAPFLREKGVKFVDIPAELRPGIDYAAYVLDPDGHALELYYYMEQIGWDGRFRAPDQRRKVEPWPWPQSLEPLSDTYTSEPFLGPLG